MKIIEDGYTAPREVLEPTLGDKVYIAPEACVVGDVRLGDGVSVWPGAVLRGDIAPVIVGEGTNLQDHVICHVANDKPCVIGKKVTVGHRATIHACTIGDGCLIGMGAIVLDDAVVGEGSLIAAGCVVSPRTIIPPRSLVVGLPGKVKRELTEEQAAQGANLAMKYFALAQSHAAGLYKRAK